MLNPGRHRLYTYLLAMLVVALCLSALPSIAQQAPQPPASPVEEAAAVAAQAKNVSKPEPDTPETFLEFFAAGGGLMWALLGCSIVAAAFAMERIVSLRRARVVDDAAYRCTVDVLQSSGAAAALEHVRGQSTPMSRVLGAVLECHGSPRAEMEAVVENAGARELWDLQRNAKPLGLVSNISPLLGLLGTVIGIIRAFTDVAAKAEAIGNPGELATGIYVALITTAAGLTVAIPAYLLYHFFRDKADALIRDIEQKALGLISVMFEQTRSARQSGTATPAGRTSDGGVDEGA